MCVHIPIPGYVFGIELAQAQVLLCAAVIVAAAGYGQAQGTGPIFEKADLLHAVAGIPAFHAPDAAVQKGLKLRFKPFPGQPLLSLAPQGMGPDAQAPGGFDGCHGGFRLDPVPSGDIPDVALDGGIQIGSQAPVRQNPAQMGLTGAVAAVEPRKLRFRQHDAEFQPQLFQPEPQLLQPQPSALLKGREEGRMLRVIVIAQDVALARRGDAGKFHPPQEAHVRRDQPLDGQRAVDGVVVRDGKHPQPSGAELLKQLPGAVRAVRGGGVDVQIDGACHIPSSRGRYLY